MEYNAKSAIVGRSGKRDEEGNGPVFIHLLDQNDPHKSEVVPKEFIDFEGMHKIKFKGLNVSYLLAGSDVLINNLVSISAEEEEGKPGNLIVSGKQSE